MGEPIILGMVLKVKKFMMSSTKRSMVVSERYFLTGPTMCDTGVYLMESEESYAGGAVIC